MVTKNRDQNIWFVSSFCHSGLVLANTIITNDTSGVYHPELVFKSLKEKKISLSYKIIIARGL